MVKILCFYLKKQPSYCTRYKKGNLLLCLSYLDKNLPKDVRFPTNSYK